MPMDQNADQFTTNAAAYQQGIMNIQSVFGAPQPPTTEQLQDGVSMVLVYEQALNMDTAERDKLFCYVKDATTHYYSKGVILAGWTWDVNQAETFKLPAAILYIAGLGDGMMKRARFYILKPDPGLREGQKCKLEECLPAPIIELIKMAPGAPETRAQVLARTLIPIPDEHQTFEAIKEWIEMNITPTTKLKAAHKNKLVFEAEFTRTETEHGECSYTRRSRGRATFGITEEDISAFMDEADGDFDRLSSMVLDAFRGMESDNPIETELVDEDTSDHEANNIESDLEPRGPFSDSLAIWIRHHFPEDADELGL